MEVQTNENGFYWHENVRVEIKLGGKIKVLEGELDKKDHAEFLKRWLNANRHDGHPVIKSIHNSIGLQAKLAEEIKKQDAVLLRLKLMKGACQ